jgi:hypothetical protein
MDLSAFYGAYRDNGQGRAAYEPSPDHSTIAEFRRRHERASGELFTAVLALCDEAGLVEAGVISIDGTKIRANASRGANRTYERLVADILKEAEETDRWEDGLFGEDRGGELPEHLRTEEGRRAAFKAAKERLAQRAGGQERPDVAQIVVAPDATRGRGRRAWHREAHKELLRRREQAARPIPDNRPGKLLEAVHRLHENHQVQIQASEDYEAWQAERRRACGRPEARDATTPVDSPADTGGCDEQDRPRLTDDAHPGPADDPGLHRAGGGDPWTDHRGGGNRG